MFRTDRSQLTFDCMGDEQCFYITVGPPRSRADKYLSYGFEIHSDSELFEFHPQHGNADFNANIRVAVRKQKSNNLDQSKLTIKYFTASQQYREFTTTVFLVTRPPLSCSANLSFATDQQSTRNLELTNSSSEAFEWQMTEIPSGFEMERNSGVIPGRTSITVRVRTVTQYAEAGNVKLVARCATDYSFEVELTAKLSF